MKTIRCLSKYLPNYILSLYRTRSKIRVIDNPVQELREAHHVPHRLIHQLQSELHRGL
jgi:hypothetical protein